MFIKLTGRLFSKANNRKKQRHMNARIETSRALKLFLDTIVALLNANDADEDAIRVGTFYFKLQHANEFMWLAMEEIGCRIATHRSLWRNVAGYLS
jgi:hypothetical protein